MLTKYKNPPEPVSGKKTKRPKKNQPEPEPPKEDGTRPEGTEYFNRIKDKNNLLLPAAVHLTYGIGLGSGVILGAAKGKAYILTAKHVLWNLLGETEQPEDPPSEYHIGKYPENIRIHYDPSNINEAPRQEAPVTGINFANVTDSEKNWIYDAVLLESDNQTFVTFVKDHRFIKPEETWRYSKALPEQSGDYELLSKRDHEFIQLGFGKPKDDTVTGLAPGNYEDFTGLLQCKVSIPEANTPAPGVLFAREKTAQGVKWQTMSHGIELKAGNTCSTAGGDSGGPLFAVSDDLTAFYLVGVTTGANYYTDQQPRPEKKINNNVATYWEPMFQYCDDTFLQGED